MRYVLCAAIVLTCISLRAQTPPVRPQFEVASVKLAAKAETQGAVAVLREVQRNRRMPGMIPMTAPDRIHLTREVLHRAQTHHSIQR